MKTLIITAALIGGIALPTMSFAGPFGLPDHERNGYRDTGCDALAAVEVRNSKGDLLYIQNATCPAMTGSTGHYVDGDGDPATAPTWESLR